MLRIRWCVVSSILILQGLQIVATAVEPPRENGSTDALALFKQRVTPILAAKNPSSCSECHLSGVDLKAYIRGTQEETFAALRDGGLIDMKQPAASKLLTFIARKPEKSTPVRERVRQEEYAAFRAWIEAAVKDPKLAAAKTADGKIGPSVPIEVVRHARQDRVLASFLENVWSEVGRCAACHSPDRNQKQVKEHGEQVSWIKLQDPQATLAYMLEADLVDLEKPDQSLLLLKPTNQVKHGGGVKLVVGDRTYKQFRRFIEDYAASAKGQYRTAAELPPASREVSRVTEIWLKLTDVPARFDKQTLQTDLYRWDEGAKDWSKARWATGDRLVFGQGKLWQQHLSLVAPRDSERAKSLEKTASLPPGKYLVKIYIDQEGSLQKKYPYELGEREFVGQVEVTSRWPAGYGAMTVTRFPGP
jgi:hypothetical protein